MTQVPFAATSYGILWWIFGGRCSGPIAALGRAELQAHLCDDREIIDLLFTRLHPVQAAFERPGDPVPAPYYMPADVIADAPR